MKTRFVFAGIAVIALIACSFHSIAAQQSQERVIKRMPIEQNEPIEITDIKVNGQSVSFDKKFAADDEWLKSLVISIKNKSDKLILFASIRLQFPRLAGSRERVSIYQMETGNAALPMRLPTLVERLVGIRPNETAELKFSPQEFAQLRDFLSMTQYPFSIEKVDLTIARVIFEDDTMWYAGSIARRHPKEPRTWIF
jgi:hypothetical protein